MIPSRPLALVDIVSETLTIYRRSFWRYALFVLLLFVPGMAIVTAGAVSFSHDAVVAAQQDIGFGDTELTALRNDAKVWFAQQNPIYAQELPVTDTSHFPKARTQQLARYWKGNFTRFPSSLSVFVLGLALLFLGIFGLVAVTVDLACQVFEERAQEFWEPLRDAFTKYVWRLALLYLLYLAVSWSVNGILLMFPPNISSALASFATMIQIYIIIRFAAVVPAIVSEGLGPLPALVRSWALTYRAGWRIFGVSLVIGILLFFGILLLSMIMSFAPGNVFIWLNDFLTRDHLRVAWLLQSLPGMLWSIALGSGIAMLVLFSVVPIFGTVLYYDLRTRRDGPLVYLEE